MLLSYLTTHKGDFKDLFRCIISVQRDLRHAGIVDYEHLVFIDGDSLAIPFINSLDISNVIFIYSPINHGKAYCINKLISYAKGKYLFFLDSDDWNLLGRTSSQLHVLESSSNLIYGSNFLFWDGKNYFSDSNYPLDNLNIKLNFWRYPYILYSSISVRKDVIVSNNLFFSEDLRAGLDYEFYSRAFSSLCVKNSKEPLVVYQVGSKNGITSNPATRLSQLAVHKKIMASMLGLSLLEHNPLIDFLFDFVLGVDAKQVNQNIVQLSKSFLNSIECSDSNYPYFADVPRALLSNQLSSIMRASL